MTDYNVALDVYNGPLDLLLFLIRREEVDIYDIPIARITEQYVEYVELLRRLDPDGVSEFLVLAATLMEIKSRTLLPRPPVDEGDEEIVDPRLELVRQLLEYKKFKDAARFLDDAAVERAKKHGRSPVIVPLPDDELEIENLDIWDLCDAFRRLLEQTGQREAVHQVGIDDTPIALHAEDIIDAIGEAGGSQSFMDMFMGRGKAELIGLFLALLELIRQRRVRVSQDRPFGTIWLHLLDASPLTEVAEPESGIEPESPEEEFEESLDREEATEPQVDAEPDVPDRDRGAEAVMGVDDAVGCDAGARKDEMEMDDEAERTDE
ncbi:MAG: segregation/condensation protein A [Phycisphaerae bacterium]